MEERFKKRDRPMWKEFNGELCRRLPWGDYITKNGHYIHDDSFSWKMVIPINKKIKII